MRIIVSFIKNDKAKVKAVGKTLDLLTLLVAISKCLAEKISEEKGIGYNKAEEFLIECIKDGIKTIN